MEDFLAAVILGLVYGSAYALLALGIVLIYKGSRIFNFAQTEFGTVAAFVVYLLQFHAPYPVAFIVGVAAATLMGLAVDRFVVQPLFTRPRVTLLVATAAVALGSIALQFAIGGAEFRILPPMVEGTAFKFVDVAVSWSQLFVVLALAGLALLLFAFFRTPLGTAVLAASQEPVATDLVGIGTRRMSALVWGMAGLLGGIAGALVASFGTLTPAVVTANFLVFSFVAAVVGGMTSLPGAVVGGLLLGLVQQLSQTYLSGWGPVERQLAAGVPQVAVFLLLVVVLAVRPAGLLGKEA